MKNNIEQKLPGKINENKDNQIKDIIKKMGQDLVDFSKENNLSGLEDRIKRGLDPVGMVALKETSEKVRGLSEKMGCSYDKVLEMIIDIHKCGPWNYSSQLKESSDPVIKVWVVLNSINNYGKDREMDMTESEFVKDLNRIKKLLDDACANPNLFFSESSKNLLDLSKKQFRIEDGVPISEKDNGFVDMALSGYESGIVQDADGFLFVGAKKIDDNIFLQWNLRPEQRGDGRGHMATFYVNNKGEAVVKKIHSDFVIVLSRNFDLAKAIVKASREVDQGLLGHKVYDPTSMPKRYRKNMVLKGTPRIKNSDVVTPRNNVENMSKEERYRNTFYNTLAFIKAREIFRDSSNVKIRKIRENRQGRVTDDTLEAWARKTEEKIRQKMEELQYMISSVDGELDKLPPDTDKIVDMAGGAGDLGLALTMEMMLRGKEVRETDIVDPVEGLAVFNKLIIGELPDAEKFKKIVNYKSETLQEFKIPENSVVVAKHACGDLTDTIIEHWVKSNSPFLVIMTCCQDKAKKQPSRYGISQIEWEEWCRNSAKTNSGDPKIRAQGMEAMTKLDEARVRYLERFGFEAKLLQTDKFPKGDIIVAKRKI
ncbi:MAG: methyltransferase [bacterium]